MGMKKLLATVVALALLAAGCARNEPAAAGETVIGLEDGKVTVDGAAASRDMGAAVYVGADIVYYHDGTDETYGEGTAEEAHTAQEAAGHTVVTITRPGTYRLTGTLTQGQIAVDLGQEAKDDPEAVVDLILDNANVTCTVAPALIFYNVYECDRAFVAHDRGESGDYRATPTVDTSAAGANVVIAAGSVNTFQGSHVARIYQEGTTEKLHKYDGAFYSRMSMNLNGDNGDDSGLLTIVGDSEGLDSELHLTLNGGTVRIQSQDDGINTNEDLVSVTTVNGGSLTVNAGLGAEGDGIDSNGYLVVNGGTVWTMANERSADGGIDADGGIFLNGGTVAAFGTRNDPVDGDSAQPYLELAFAQTVPQGGQVEVTNGAGKVVWSGTAQRDCRAITLSTPGLDRDGDYQVTVDGVVQDLSDASRDRGGPGGRPPEGMGEPPEGMPEPPEGMGEPPEGMPERPEGMGKPPEDMPEPPERPGGMTV